MARLLPGTRALRTLEAAARHLNFTRAADELGLTPAAVSHQIKEIEDQLGIVLFTRTSRTIRLTEAGAVLRVRCCSRRRPMRSTCLAGPSRGRTRWRAERRC
jgi:DNA-binding transcriptional LysR family regulator